MEDLQLDEMLSYSFLEDLHTGPDTTAMYSPINTKFKFEEWLASQVAVYETQYY